VIEPVALRRADGVDCHLADVGADDADAPEKLWSTTVPPGSSGTTLWNFSVSAAESQDGYQA